MCEKSFVHQTPKRRLPVPNQQSPDLADDAELFCFEDNRAYTFSISLQTSRWTWPTFMLLVMATSAKARVGQETSWSGISASSPRSMRKLLPISLDAESYKIASSSLQPNRVDLSRTITLSGFLDLLLTPQ